MNNKKRMLSAVLVCALLCIVVFVLFLVIKRHRFEKQEDLTEDTTYSESVSEEVAAEDGTTGNVEETNQTAEAEEVNDIPNELRSDFAISGYEPRRFANSIFGSRYKRNEIRRIVFKDTLEEKGKEAWDISREANGSIFAWVNGRELTIASNGIIVFPSDCSGLFAAYTGLRAIDFGDKIDTSSVTNMESMFEQCYNLTALDLSGFDTSKVKSMAYMFSRCRSLTALMIGNFDTSRASNMTAMFSGCNSLEEVDLSSFDTRNVTGMESIFQDCRELSYLNLTSFDTANVESGRNMFSGCYSMEILDFDPSSFRTESMTDMYGMFRECYRLKKLNVGSFDTSNVRNMSYMFYKDRKLTSLDFKKFDMSKVTEKDKMLKGTQWEDSV